MSKKTKFMVKRFLEMTEELTKECEQNNASTTSHISGITTSYLMRKIIELEYKLEPPTEKEGSDVF